MVMEPYSSSSSSSLLSFSLQKQGKANIPKYYNASLHSIRKSKTSTPAKITKKPIAPMPPPTPPRVYLIDPSNFKELVQKLTAAPEFQNSSRLQKLAPPPVDVVIDDPLQMSNSFMNRVHYRSASCSAVETLESAKNSPSGWFGNLLSPSSNGWFGNLLSPPSNGLFSPFPVLSPGSISAFELNTVP